MEASVIVGEERNSDQWTVPERAPYSFWLVSFAMNNYRLLEKMEKYKPVPSWKEYRKRMKLLAEIRKYRREMKLEPVARQFEIEFQNTN